MLATRIRYNIRLAARQGCCALQRTTKFVALYGETKNTQKKGITVGDIFKNKFFIILLIVICVLTLSTIILNLTGHGSIVTDIVNLILTPFQNFSVIIKDSFAGFTAYFTEFNRLKDENEELKKIIEDLEYEVQDTRRLRDENEGLMAFYGLKSKRMSYEFCPAKITARDPGNYISGFTINKGTVDAVEKDMPVIAAVGSDYAIIGYISEVGLLYSKIVSFIRAGEAIGAYIESTGEIGMVEGKFELEKEGLCRISFSSKETVLEVGEKIYSSGSGGIYPEDLYIGEVISVEADPNSHTMIGIIEPAADFSAEKDVMVILKFDRNFY